MARRLPENLLPFAAVAVSLTVGVFASQTVAAIVANSHAVPVAVSPARVNFGRLAEGRVARQTVQITNTSDAMLTVARIQTSCGCTTTDAPKQIPAHASVPLTVRFDSHAKRGPVGQNVLLFVAGHESTPVTIPVGGTVVEELALSSPSLALGTLRCQTSKTGTLTLTRRDGSPLRILRVQAPSHIHARAEPLAPNAARLVVSLHAPSVPGRHQDTLTVHTDDAAMPEVTVPVEYSVTGEFVARPKEINFGAVTDGKAVRANVKISGPNEATLRVTKTPDGMTATVQQTGKGAWVLETNYTPKGGKSQLVNSQIIIKTDNATQPEIIVPVLAAVSS